MEKSAESSFGKRGIHVKIWCKLNLEKREVVVTECSHGEEEVSAVTNPRDGFVKLNKKKYAIELPKECHCQTYCAPHPART